MQELKDVPQSLVAEAAVVACCIWDSASLPLVFEICEVTDFVDPYMSNFIAAIKAVWDDQTPVDRVTVEQRLRDMGQMSDEALTIWEGIVSGNSATCLPTVSNVEYYAKLVREKRYERQLIGALDQMSQDVYDKSLKVSEKKELFEQAILSLSLENDTRDGSLQAIGKRIWDSLHAEADGEICIQTGYEEIDREIGGFGPGEMAIVAARPSNGKSTMLMEMALSISLRHPVLVLSMEMSQESLTYRVLSYLSHVPVLNIRSGDLPTDQEQRVKTAYEALGRYKVYVDETPMLTPACLGAKILRAKATYNIGCVMLDYLQLMHIPKWRGENRNAEITRISNEVRAAAKRARLPIVVASQMSRAIEGRADGEPRLSDLRDSGAIEQDADYVLFLYPYKEDVPSSYDKYVPGPNDPRQQCCKIAKSRQGRRDIHINFHWQPAFYTFKKDVTEGQVVSAGDVPF